MCFSSRMLFVLLIALQLIFQGKSIFSQTFTTKYSTLQDEVPTSAIETSDGGYIISAKQGYEPSLQYQALLIKLNQYGDTVKTILLEDSIGNCNIYKLIKTNDNNFFGIGSFQKNSAEMNIWLVKMDKDLNILNERFYVTNCNNLDIVLGFYDHNQDLILYGDGYSNSSSSDDLFVYKISNSGDSLTSNLYVDNGIELAFNMIESPDTSGYLLSFYGSYQVFLNSFGQILKLDYDLSVSQIDSIPNFLFLYYDALALKNSILLTGIKIIPVPNQYHGLNKLGIEKLDLSMNLVIKNDFGCNTNDTLSYPGYINNLDSSSYNEIYYGGTFNQDTYYFLSEKKSWITLCKVDTNLDLKWQKYYGGDLYYGLWGLKVTSDGGCLLLGSTYDYLTQNNERDIIIMKVDSAGLITSTGPQVPPEVRSAIVYPNPGHDRLTVETGLRKAVFTLGDISGKIIFRKELEQGETTIPVDRLSAGLYFYTIQSPGNPVERGKWVKD
jgi:hypothetical protein